MRKVTFEFNAPGAKQVYLAGDFTGWQENAKRMAKKRSQAGVFATAVTLAPGTYEYKFIVDGEWKEDPSAEMRSNRYGTANSVINIA